MIDTLFNDIVDDTRSIKFYCCHELVLTCCDVGRQRVKIIDYKLKYCERPLKFILADNSVLVLNPAYRHWKKRLDRHCKLLRRLAYKHNVVFTNLDAVNGNPIKHTTGYYVPSQPRFKLSWPMYVYYNWRAVLQLSLWMMLIPTLVFFKIGFKQLLNFIGQQEALYTSNKKALAFFGTALMTLLSLEVVLVVLAIKYFTIVWQN